MNVKLLKQIIKVIEKKPLRLTMREWIEVDDIISPCNTTACIAGHALILNKSDLSRNWVKNANFLCPGDFADDNNRIPNVAQDVLDLTTRQANKLFYLFNWPEPFQSKVRKLDENRKDDRLKISEITIERIKFFIKTKGADRIAK